jgi:hypothetical protein
MSKGAILRCLSCGRRGRSRQHFRIPCQCGDMKVCVSRPMYLIAQKLRRAGFLFRFAIANYDGTWTPKINIKVSFLRKYSRVLFVGLPPAYITSHVSDSRHVYGITYRREITEGAGLDDAGALRAAIQPLADWADDLDPEATRALIVLLDNG